MAKTIPSNSVGTQLPQYVHPDGQRFSYPPVGRVVSVGTVSALENAIFNAQQYDLIRIVAPGVYILPNTLVNLVPDVTVIGATLNASDTVLRGPGMDNAAWGNAPHCFYSQQPGLTLLNLTIEQFYFHAITFGAGAARPVCRNVILQDLGQQFVKASQFPSAIDDGLFEDCIFRYTNGRPLTNHFDIDGTTQVGWFYGGLVDVHNSARWVMRRCRGVGVTPTQAEIDRALSLEPGAVIHYWSPAFYFWNRSRDTIVEDCRFLDCARSVNFGLIQRGGGQFDHQGGVIRNCFAALSANRLSAAQTADSDGMINAWDSPGTKILHNSIITRGQVADAIQGRWSTGLEIASNLSDDSIRMRDAATYAGANNVQNAQLAWFVDPATGDLRLNATGNSNAGMSARLPDAMTDILGAARAATTNRGAHHYG